MKDDAYTRTVVMMGTFVTIQVVDRQGNARAETEEQVERAFEWFRRIEDTCSRFDAGSELMQLTMQVGLPVPVSATLFEAVRFAVTVASETGGAFDPTVGHRMEALGFNREHRTGQVVRSAPRPEGAVSYRDVQLDPEAKTIRLVRPLILDLGAVAKGLAVDMAARELARYENYSIDAGGDLYLAGVNPEDEAWSVGIRHPRQPDRLIDVLHVSNAAVCTSGDYEHPAPGGEAGHHIVDPRTGKSPETVASVTVIAPTATVADALATAAFVLGPADGLQCLERLGVDGLIVSPDLEEFATAGMRRDWHLGRAAPQEA